MMCRRAALLAVVVAVATRVHPVAAARLESLPKISDAKVLFSPAPEYPLAARARRITGTGKVIIEVDAATGNVSRAYMAPGTGFEVLDSAALSAFRRWRFAPGSPAKMQTPITFGMTTGSSGNVAISVRPMDDVLARFLGKGTVVEAPVPTYPVQPAWTDKEGRGVYELHASANGRVQQVKVLKTSGDAVFDRQAVKTLGAWRLRRGPVVLELPLRFKLTPTSYSVDVAP